MQRIYSEIIKNRLIFRQFKIDGKRVIIWLSLVLLIADWIYKTINGINLTNREQCILNNFLPSMAFYFYEYFIELFLIVISGIFIGNVISKYFQKFRNLVPRNQIMAFVMASVIPICSCSAIPLIASLHDKIKPRVIFTFILAAPVLNPYIIFLAFTGIGFFYGVLRILSILVLSISIGWIMEKFMDRTNNLKIMRFAICKEETACTAYKSGDVYDLTFRMLRKILPFIVIAGILGFAIELWHPLKMLHQHYFGNSAWGVLIAVIVGIPMYLCNGADILFLSPLMRFAHFGMGGAIAFSLTSTMICVSSIAMLVPIIGRKATLVLTFSIFLFSILIGVIINLFINYFV